MRTLTKLPKAPSTEQKLAAIEAAEEQAEIVNPKPAPKRRTKPQQKPEPYPWELPDTGAIKIFNLRKSAPLTAMIEFVLDHSPRSLSEHQLLMDIIEPAIKDKVQQILNQKNHK